MSSTFRRAIAELAPIIEDITNKIRQWIELKVKKEGGVGEVARKMANAVIDASIGMVRAFESISNGIIDVINNFNDFRKTIPAAMGGLRSAKDIMSEINDEDTIPLSGKWQRLHRELEMVKKSSIPLEHINLSPLVTQMEGYKIAAMGVQEPLEKILDTTTAMKDTSWLSEMKEQWNGVKSGLKAYIKTSNDAEETQKSLKSVGMKAAQTLEDAFVKMAMGVKVSFKDMARSIIADLIRMRIRKQLAGVFDSLLNPSTPSLGSTESFNTGSREFLASKGGSITEIPFKPNYAGGGFTGSGGRSGGVDGKGGFNAILHPNETVTDHTKGQSQGQTVVVNYSPQINSLDPRTAQIVISENAPTIVGIIRQAFNRNGQQVGL